MIWMKGDNESIAGGSRRERVQEKNHKRGKMYSKRRESVWEAYGVPRIKGAQHSRMDAELVEWLRWVTMSSIE